jgi:hypothetical protein
VRVPAGRDRHHADARGEARVRDREVEVGCSASACCSIAAARAVGERVEDVVEARGVKFNRVPASISTARLNTGTVCRRRALVSASVGR